MDANEIIRIVAVLILAVMGTYFNYKFKHIDDPASKKD